MLFRSLHGKQVAVDDAGVAHAHAAHLEQVVGATREHRHTREDEDALTDLLNERSRGGWEPAMMTQDDARLTVVFARVADAEAQSERS